MDKPTIALITAVWKRPELTGLVLNRFKNIKFELSNKINLEKKYTNYNFGIGRSEGFRNPTIYELYGTDNYGYSGNNNLN